MSPNPVILRYTSGRETFAVHADASISRPAIGMAPSGEWKLRGLTDRYGRVVVPFDQLAAKLPTLDLFYKNGKPRYMIADLDHGTSRVQGSPGYSAIRAA